MKPILFSAALLCGALFATNASANTADTWTPEPERWNPTHSIRIVVAFEPNANDDCLPEGRNATACKRIREDLVVDGVKRSVYRHDGLTRKVTSYIDHLNYLFRLNDVPIQAEMADAFRMDRNIDGNDLMKGIRSDRLVRHFKNLRSADDVIIITGRATSDCGRHSLGSKASFKPFGYVTEGLLLCVLQGGTGPRTFAHEVGHGMGLHHPGTGMYPAYGKGGSTWTWVTAMGSPGVHGGLTIKDTWSNPHRKCDLFYRCGGQHNDADAARFLKEAAKYYRPISGVRLFNTASRECLDVEHGLKQGNRLVTWPCHGGANQKFRIQADGRILVGGLCLDVPGGKNVHKAKVVVWPCHGGANQKWVVEPNGLIRSQLHGPRRCLDVVREEGDAIVLWECASASPDQTFIRQ